MVYGCWPEKPLDEQTGLPVVPEDCFWRVERSINNSHKISLMKKKKNFLGFNYDVEVDYTYCTGNTPLTKERVLDEALYVMYKQDKYPESMRFLPEKERKNFSNTLYGDYPPKKL